MVRWTVAPVGSDRRRRAFPRKRTGVCVVAEAIVVIGGESMSKPIIRVGGPERDDAAMRVAAAGLVDHAYTGHAYTGHAESVAALLCDSVAAKLGHEMAGFVPMRNDLQLGPGFRFRLGGGSDRTRTACQVITLAARKLPVRGLGWWRGGGVYWWVARLAEV